MKLFYVCLVLIGLIAACETGDGQNIQGVDAMVTPDATDTVYRCTNAPDTGVLVVCFDGSSGELEDQLGPFGPPDWTCMAQAGTCHYYCPAGATGTTGDGTCDTKNGCWCRH